MGPVSTIQAFLAYVVEIAKYDEWRGKITFRKLFNVVQPG